MVVDTTEIIIMSYKVSSPFIVISVTIFRKFTASQTLPQTKWDFDLIKILIIHIIR